MRDTSSVTTGSPVEEGGEEGLVVDFWVVKRSVRDPEVQISALEADWGHSGRQAVPEIAQPYEGMTTCPDWK